MATTLGGFLTGIGLCCLIIVLGHIYGFYSIVVQGHRPEISDMVIPTFFGGLASILGLVYVIVRAREKVPPKEVLPFTSGWILNYFFAIIGAMVGTVITIFGIFTMLSNPVFLIVIPIIGILIVLLSVRKSEDLDRIKKEKTKALPPASPTEVLPASPTSEQNKYSIQYYCRACGHMFWIDEHPEFEASHCQKCGASDLMLVAKLEYVETPPPETIRIRIEQGKPSPPSSTTSPLPFEQKQVKYKSQFNCKACGQSFWVSEHRFKVPYCLNCGAPDPVHIETIEQ